MGDGKHLQVTNATSDSESCPSSPSFVWDKKLPVKADDDVGCGRQGETTTLKTLMAVSYTHLDVYKRQVYVQLRKKLKLRE